MHLIDKLSYGVKISLQTCPDTNPAQAAEPEYIFSNPVEADVTYLIIAWFAVTESAALGIFPILPALQLGRSEGVPALHQFFKEGMQHFRDEQRHANMWCRALQDFAERYPEVVSRVAMPEWLLKIMLKSIGKPHNLRNFAIDCLAFETVMRAFYDVAYPRLHYPPILPIFRTIMKDEQDHTNFGHNYIFKDNQKLSRRESWGIAFRYWRNVAGVLITVQPLIKALNRLEFLPYRQFSAPLALYIKETGIAGSQGFIPAFLSQLPF